MRRERGRSKKMEGSTWIELPWYVSHPCAANGGVSPRDPEHDMRIDTQSGRLISGAAAPMKRNLDLYLKDRPYMQVKTLQGE